MKKKTPTSGTRTLAVKLKTARGRKISSQLWLMRQLNDPYVQKAQALGYRSRAAFKLIEMDEKYGLLGPGKHVVDLGAAPGGWVQVAVEKTGSLPGQEIVIGIDLKPIDPIPGSILIEGDFLHPEMPDKLKALLKGPVDLVLSDMAASSSGHAPTDHLRIMMLAEVAFDFAKEVLKPGGSYVAKVLQGGAEGDLLRELKQKFTKVVHSKPPASRPDSAEMYVVAIGFKK
ncbi:Ribosomal RNA large subunit methyltransferase E [Candidatus Bealeia paramacronuclearis]|uniref:Ribosomal RNA large subunit methyltransferase E n=1 Tax=Candidatus Bealeia paramacronuclearis TaxID=1921001 RepID=A0ABZ2C377_9PROT|nr:Ribosomal RNA large subunit methyltransferase E [Candidatus Bealeia paramacronuclearis]